jgi:hypothetical protein
MRRLFASTSALAATIGILALLGAGGGYAIASNASKQTDKRSASNASQPAAPSVAARSVHAYAHVIYHNGSGTATMNLKHGMGNARVRVDGNGGFCFSHLPFTPFNAQATVDWQRSTEDDTAQVAVSPHGNAGCATRAEHVRVETSNRFTGAEEHVSFYISFN